MFLIFISKLACRSFSDTEQGDEGGERVVRGPGRVEQLELIGL